MRRPRVRGQTRAVPEHNVPGAPGVNADIEEGRSFGSDNARLAAKRGSSPCIANERCRLSGNGASIGRQQREARAPTSAHARGKPKTVAQLAQERWQGDKFLECGYFERIV